MVRRFVCLLIRSSTGTLLIFGASGTMKSRAVIRPYLIQSVKRQESVIVTDSKSELYNDMAGYFVDNGYEVKVFNLVDPRHSDSWNCMADLQQDTLLAQVLSDIIISNTSGERGDHFWDNGEANLLKALVLYVDHTTAFGAERRNLPEVYRFLAQTNERQLSALFDKLPWSTRPERPTICFASPATRCAQVSCSVWERVFKPYKVSRSSAS